MVTLHNWFETKIQYEKIGTDDGKQRKQTDVYLVDALSFSKAEERTIKEAALFMTGDFTVTSIKRKKYYEIFEEIPGINMVDSEANKLLGVNKNQSETADKWYECKLNFIILDEEKGREKKIASTVLVNANSPRVANDTLVEKMRGTMSDWELVKIAETPILEIFQYKVKEE